MAKVKKTTVVVKCECSVCGQVAHVEAGTQHHFCRGIRLVGPLPTMFMSLSKPDNKGTWQPWEAKTKVGGILIDKEKEGGLGVHAA